jgi:hypothetical protein
MRTAFCIVLALGSMAAAAPALKGGVDGRYYATRLGAKWVYDADGKEYTHIVTKVEDTDGGKIVFIGKDEGGKITPVRKLTVTDKGIFQDQDGDEKLDPPFCYLKLPAKVKDTWEANPSHQGKIMGRGTRTLAGYEEIEVPAGKFRAVRVDWDYTPVGQPTYKIKTWYAPGVGMVKMVSGKLTTVLQKFSPGKD